jgi:hypothetical protein
LRTSLIFPYPIYRYRPNGSSDRRSAECPSRPIFSNISVACVTGTRVIKVGTLADAIKQRFIWHPSTSCGETRLLVSSRLLVSYSNQIAGGPVSQRRLSRMQTRSLVSARGHWQDDALWQNPQTQAVTSGKGRYSFRPLHGSVARRCSLRWRMR